MTKVVGYFLLVFSFLTWGAIALIPFFDVTAGKAAAIATGLVISGEGAFVLSIALLGKEVWNKIKSVLTRRTVNPEQ